MRIPKKLWIIYDPLDGPHLFKSKAKADKTLNTWKNEALDQFDSVWDMSQVIEYERK